MTDSEILTRITYDPFAGLTASALDATKLTPIPFPTEFAPKPVTTTVKAGSALPAADVLVVTYTVAEGYALADTLTPGVNTTEWHKYTNGWSAIRKLIIGDDAPSIESKCAALWYETKIGDKTVIVMKSELHPSTDGTNLPIRTAWKQWIEQSNPSLVITTGTAGGIGAETQLGDVVIAETVKWNAQKQFKDETWANGSYVASTLSINTELDLPKLIAVNASKLGTYLKRPVDVVNGDIETTDFFAFADNRDTYGLAKFDETARAVEMDDAALGLAIADLGADAPRWTAIRNASDPQMNEKTLAEEDKDAEKIYETYGYDTSICSALTCWAIIASM